MASERDQVPDLTDDLDQALEKSNLYTPAGKNAKNLIVFVPGLGGNPADYKDLLRLLLASDEPPFSDCHLLPFRYPGQFSFTNPDRVVQNLNRQISSACSWRAGDGGVSARRRDPTASQYQTLFLVAHSMGALIARAAVLERGHDFPGPFLEQVGAVRLILLAGTNRGLILSRLPLLRRLVVQAAQAAGLPILAISGLRGSDWVNRIRLEWISSTGRLPDTVQILGEGDRIVAKDDSLDIYRWPNTAEIRLPGVNHDFRKIPEDGIRAIRSAFTAQIEQGPSESGAGAEGDEPPPPPAGPPLPPPHPGPPIALSRPPKSGSQPSCLVFLIHGIRDFADWQEALGAEVEALDPAAKIIPVQYGYFTALQFLLPSQRSRTTRAFIDRYTQEHAKHPDVPVYVAAHSNGTYVFAASLRKHSAIRVVRAYLAGSVLPRSFDWGTIAQKNNLKAVRNDCANGDWAVGALCWLIRLVPLYGWWLETGTAGSLGFCPPNAEAIVKLTPPHAGHEQFLPFRSAAVPHTLVVHNNRFLDGEHGAALGPPYTTEIAHFLIHGSPVHIHPGHRVDRPRFWWLWVGRLAAVLGVACILAGFCLIWRWFGGTPAVGGAVACSAALTAVVLWWLLWV